MNNNSNTDRQIKNQNGNSELIITDFGTRTIHNQNFSKMVALPKTALTNCGITTQVNVQLVYENGIKYIKLIPISGDKP